MTTLNTMTMSANSITDASTVTVTVLYFAQLSAQADKESEVVAVSAQTSVADLYQQLSQQYDFELCQSQLSAAVNHQLTQWRRILEPDDVVAFIPPVAGG